MYITEDLKVFAQNGISKKIVILLTNPCFHSVCLFRLSSLLYKIHLSPLSKLVWYLNRLLFHVDIDYRADLAGGFMLVHGLGVVIGKEVVSKGHLIVYQNVTLGGGNGKPPRQDEDGKMRGMPLFLGDAIVYAGAIAVGGIVIREHTTIKAGSIICNDV